MTRAHLILAIPFVIVAIGAFAAVGVRAGWFEQVIDSQRKKRAHTDPQRIRARSIPLDDAARVSGFRFDPSVRAGGPAWGPVAAVSTRNRVTGTALGMPVTAADVTGHDRWVSTIAWAGAGGGPGRAAIRAGDGAGRVKVTFDGPPEWRSALHEFARTAPRPFAFEVHGAAVLGWIPGRARTRARLGAPHEVVHLVHATAEAAAVLAAATASPDCEEPRVGPTSPGGPTPR